MQRTIVQVLGYLLFGLVIFVLFVYVMFPYDLLRQRLVDSFSQGDMQVEIARMKPTFPLGLSLEQVQVTTQRPNAPEEVMKLQTLRAWPKWLSMLSNSKQVRFDGELYSGNMTGEVHYVTTDGEVGWESAAQFEGLDVSQYGLLQQLQSTNKLAVQGRLSGEATAKLNARGKLQASDFNFLLKPAVFSPGEAARLPLRREIPCDTLKGDVVVDVRQWQINDFTCQGNDVFVDMRGTVRPRQPVENSVLNLRMELRSDEAFKEELGLLRTLVRQRPSQDGNLKFGLRGPLNRPRAVR